MIHIKENNKSVEEFNLLYNSVGWVSYDRNISKKALDNTFYSLSVYYVDIENLKEHLN